MSLARGVACIGGVRGAASGSVQRRARRCRCCQCCCHTAAAVAAANGTAPARLHRILLGCTIPAHPCLSPLAPANSCSFPLGRLCWSPLSAHIRLAFISAHLGRSPTWSSLLRLRVASDRAHLRVRSRQLPLLDHACLALVRYSFALVRARSYPLVCLTFVWVCSCSFGLGWGSLRARLLFKSISKTKLIHT